MEGQASVEMPRYKCHKEVWALKIKAIEIKHDEKGENEVVGVITPEDTRYAAFAVDETYLSKHKPEAGGYYVVYTDGYKSFSPAKAFEDGYSLA